MARQKALTVRVSYTVRVPADLRQALAAYVGQTGYADRDLIRRLYRGLGDGAMDLIWDDWIQEQKRKAEHETD